VDPKGNKFVYVEVSNTSDKQFNQALPRGVLTINNVIDKFNHGQSCFTVSRSMNLISA
jgi:hypothetical protein